MKDTKNKVHYLIISFIIFSFVFQVFCFNLINSSINFPNNSLNLIETENQEKIRLSAEEEIAEQWLDNPEFDSPIEPWFSLEEGDTSVVEATSEQAQANYRILGEQRTFSNVSGTPKATDWTIVHNPAFPDYPDYNTTDQYGCYANHNWDEGADQSPSVHWDRNITMPVNMTDYIITSASLSAVVNATVTASPVDAGGIEVPGDTMDDYATFDYVRFYVMFSDLEKNKIYEASYNQTITLGDDDAGVTDYMYDTFMTSVPEEFLIFYLTSVLSTDNYNFTITLGMRIWCEDSDYSDEDNWDHLRIKSCNLTFTYAKIIKKFTSVSWNQIGDEISGKNIQITNATLKFKYKTNQLWPSSSPNSEIRIFINNKQHSETIKLSSATTSFKKAKKEGFDVTSLISKDEEISLSIQVFLADEFGLGDVITISIDDCYFYIIYVRIETGTDWTLVIYGLIAGMVALVTIFTLYQTHFKYPPMVRKVRKLKKKIKKGKKTIKPILIKNRGDVLKDSFDNQIKILELETIQPELIDKVEKAGITEKIKEIKEGKR